MNSVNVINYNWGEVEVVLHYFTFFIQVDHGKSTLSDCILQKTGNIGDKDRKRGQVLDTLKVERDRGITVKAQTASMVYLDPRTQTRYLLNLIDTPGHVDFSYEGELPPYSYAASNNEFPCIYMQFQDHLHPVKVHCCW